MAKAKVKAKVSKVKVTSIAEEDKWKKDSDWSSTDSIGSGGPYVYVSSVPCYVSHTNSGLKKYIGGGDVYLKVHDGSSTASLYFSLEYPESFEHLKALKDGVDLALEELEFQKGASEDLKRKYGIENGNTD